MAMGEIKGKLYILPISENNKCFSEINMYNNKNENKTVDI